MNLANKARSAVVWNAGFNLFRDGLQFCQMLVLARLLDPDAYGKFGLVMSIIGFLAIFSSNTMLQHTLQVKNDEETHFQDHFTAGGLLQLILFAIANAVALVFWRTEEYVGAAPLLHALSFTYLLEWTCEIRRKMIERQFDWMELRLLHGSGLLVSTLLAIAMAWMGAGAYALVVPGMVVTIPFIIDLFVRQRWRPTWQWSWARYRPAVSFGLTRIGAGLSEKGRLLLESGVLAAVLGFGPLGIVNRAIGLAQLACGKFATQLIYAIYPILTRLETENGKVVTAGNLVIRVVAWFVVPVACCLTVLAEPVVATVYGAKWLEVVPLLSWTMAWASIGAIVHSLYMLTLARNRPRLCLLTDILTLSATALCLWFVLPLGIVSYLGSLVAINTAKLLFLVPFLVRDSALTWPGLAQALFPSMVAAGLALLGANFLGDVTVGPRDTFWPAAAWGTMFFVTYTVSLRIFFVPSLHELISYFPGRASLSRALLLPQ